MENMVWRFLNTGFHDAFTNMAIDEVLSEISGPRDKRPVLRAYGWHPYAISLGYNQDVDEINEERCAQDKIDIVRRPTGGRAVLHADEVTYSVVLPPNSSIYHMDTLTIYNKISEALVTGLHSIGVKAELVERVTAGKDELRKVIPCFSTSAKYEIAYNGKKLVGSAQRRFKNSVLQHGSILYGNYHLKLGEYIANLSRDEIDRFTRIMNGKTISLSQIASHDLNYDTIIWGIKNGFQKRYNIQFFEGQLTPQEMNEVGKLIKKYKKIRRNSE